jgi:two-component system chemotaxis response regulator CheB
MIRVLVVDDSAAFRAGLATALARDSEIEVVGQAGDGEAAIALAEELRPDVVTMDVMMPVCDGIEASRRMLARRPVPILLMSTLARSDEQRMALNALRLGVVDVTTKPTLAGAGSAEGIAQVTRLVKAAASIDLAPPPRRRAGLAPVVSAAVDHPIEVIAIAASTGGPPALERLIAGLPPGCPPILVAQHLAPSFSRGFSDWLRGAVNRPVVVVGGVERLAFGSIYVAAAGQHLSTLRRGVVETRPAAPGTLSPNADVLFRSVAAAYGPRALGIVLTGMGSDGAAGLRLMRDEGAWTIAQDRESSTVDGMPRAAVDASAACEVLSLDAMPGRVTSLLVASRRTT